MRRFKRFCAVLVAALCLICPLLPASRAADASARMPVESADVGVSHSLLSAEETPAENTELIAQIQSTYAAAKKRAHRKSFKGKCGSYVNHQLVILGINKKFIGANGNREYDIYCKKQESSGGYTIRAYGAKRYTLKEALEAIESADPNARNILVGFEKGTSKAGKKYGHTLFIHGIENGMVYFSDSYAQKVDGVRYKEGAPIVCSIDTFVHQYRKYKLDGVIWFS